MIGSALTLIHADNWFRRSCGLLFRAKLKNDELLWLQPCKAVHTVGMRYSITLFYLDDDCNVIEVLREIKPNRFSINLQAASVVETLASAQLTAAQIEATIQLFRDSR
jgi:uncharacterized membrane protein (UPF0127 family)